LQGRYLHTEQQKTQNKRAHTSMPCVGIKPTIPEFERAETAHALDRAATVIGTVMNLYLQQMNIKTNEACRISNNVFV
jgi:hypothetical protein